MKMVNFVLCIFYHDLKKKNKKLEGLDMVRFANWALQTSPVVEARGVALMTSSQVPFIIAPISHKLPSGLVKNVKEILPGLPISLKTEAPSSGREENRAGGIPLA